MPPKTIYIIRHCDKPKDSKSESLQNEPACLCNKQGYYRSALLPSFWRKQLGKKIPSLLIASAFSPENPACNCEQREKLVLIPTSIGYGVDIKTPYCFYQIDETANYINNYDGIVICAWEHNHIPLLAKALGVKEDIAPWPEDRFDIVFKITYDTKAPKLTIFTQKLNLEGDSNTLPIGYRSNKPLYFILLIIIIIYISYKLLKRLRYP